MLYFCYIASDSVILTYTLFLTFFSIMVYHDIRVSLIHLIW